MIKDTHIVLSATSNFPTTDIGEFTVFCQNSNIIDGIEMTHSVIDRLFIAANYS